MTYKRAAQPAPKPSSTYETRAPGLTLRRTLKANAPTGRKPAGK